VHLRRRTGPERDWSANNPPHKPAGSYIVGLGLIGLLAVISSLIVARELALQAEDVRIVNAASNQPGLVYEITQAVTRLHQSEGRDADASAALEVALGPFIETQLGLRFGDETRGLPGDPSGEIERLFGLADAPFEEIVAVAQAALDGSTSGGRIQALEASSDAFRSRMEAISFRHQLEAEQRVIRLQRLEFGLLSVSLLLLVLEGLFLFRPAVRRTARRWQEARSRHAAERERDKARLEYLSQFDPLTGLPNRVLFRDRLNQALARAAREERSVTLLHLDLDNFNVVNDEIGHEVGDLILIEAAARISSVVRDADTVAHIGGDEFTVLLEGDGAVDGAERVASEILAALARPHQAADLRLYVTASIGVAVYPLDGDDADELARSADQAMNAAKRDGRNTCRFFTTELRNNSSDRLALITSLRHAVENNEGLSLWYQPKLDLASGAIYGAEALLRWEHPERGMVMPDQFIPIAEETDLIISLGKWVIAEACQQSRQWARTGRPDLIVSVNVSAHQFHHDGFLESVSRCLLEAEVDPAHFELELTEGTLVRDVPGALETLNRLRELGVKISIDDFGTGYSSLSYLKRLPIDILKIDRSFVDEIASNRDDAAISEAIIKLGHTLNLQVIAEGVETVSQRRLLTNMGCHSLQGFLIAPPLPVGDFENWLSGSDRRLAG
jgi:diguanylate cyclase (GGDEF)-like protein